MVTDSPDSIQHLPDRSCCDTGPLVPVFDSPTYQDELKSGKSVLLQFLHYGGSLENGGTLGILSDGVHCLNAKFSANMAFYFK